MVQALSEKLENARTRRVRLRDAGIATDQLDREILDLRRQLRDGGQLLAGDTLGDGRYLLVKQAGRGGFAVVWEAYDKRSRYSVAIKVLHSHLGGDPLRRERFFRGARAMMKLAGPTVVRVVEPIGEDGGFYYFVMELVPGGNLSDAMREKRLNKDRLLPLMLLVIDTVAQAHACGMVHRDIKPANILLDGNGNPKLTDFDLVGAADTTGGTRTGALGTFLYAAPECLDRPQEATARADVYGLGMTAIFCLSGHELTWATARNPASAIAALDCSSQLKTVLQRAVALEPVDRFADASDLARALRDTLSLHAIDGGNASLPGEHDPRSAREPDRVDSTAEPIGMPDDNAESSGTTTLRMSLTTRTEPPELSEAAADRAYTFALSVVYASADAEFVRGYLLPSLDLPASRVFLLELQVGPMAILDIERAVSRSRFTIAVLSPVLLSDHWISFSEQRASHLRLLPLLLADCELPPRLANHIALDFRDPGQWEWEITRLRHQLSTPAPAPEQTPCPYPGMHAFGIDDAALFFGRDNEIEDLISRLDRGEREIYVIGPSGSGKSSLVQAGLLAALNAGTSRLGRLFISRSIRPGERPIDQLTQALDGELLTPTATVGAFMARHSPAVRVLLFVDQLEEIFTLAGPKERERFIAALCALREDPRCCLVLALRADCYEQLLDSALWPAPTGMSRLDVMPLRGAALTKAIVGPAAHVGVHLEARLCDRLITDAGNEPGMLPFVQETLRTLWDRRRHRYIALVDYDVLGNGRRGMNVAMAEHADMAMAMLGPSQHIVAARLLLRLVSLSGERPNTRRRMTLQGLRSVTFDNEELAKVLQRLIETRLITVDGGDNRDVMVDLSHEALITGWPMFQVWIGGHRTDELRRRQLEAKVDEWIMRGRVTDALLDATELAEAAEWIQGEPARILGGPAELRALAAASRRALDGTRLHRRILATASVLFATLSVTMLILSFMVEDVVKFALWGGVALTGIGMGYSVKSLAEMRWVGGKVAPRRVRQ